MSVINNEEVNNYSDDKSGKSKVYHYAFNFKNKDNINIQCYHFSKNYKKSKNLIDNLKVMIVTKKWTIIFMQLIDKPHLLITNIFTRHIFQLTVNLDTHTTQ